VGVANEIEELSKFLEFQKARCNFYLWLEPEHTMELIPVHAPHFVGLWEAALKSFKGHLRRVIGNVKLTFEG